jgi:hypothetical protein
MDKIKAMVQDVTNCYIPIKSNYSIYLSKIDKRKEVTADTEILTLATMALKIIELSNVVNLLIDKIDILESKE